MTNKTPTYLCPIDDQIRSPAQQLTGRTRTLLPTAKQLLTPKTIRPSTVQKSIFKRQGRQKYYDDFSSKRLSPLSVGDKVTIKENKVWKPATITGKANGPRPYLVTTPEGQMHRRNRTHLRRSSAQSVTTTLPKPTRETVVVETYSKAKQTKITHLTRLPQKVCLTLNH